MKIIITRTESGRIIPRNIKDEAKKQVADEITKKLGCHVSILQEIPIVHPTDINLNGCSIYTDIKETAWISDETMDPKEIFYERIQWGKNYFFGVIETQKTKKRFVFLAEIPDPLPVGKEKILLDELRAVKVIVKQI